MAKYINADALLNYLYSRQDEQPDIAKVIAEFDAADVRENEYSHKVWCPDGSKELQCAECRAFVDCEDKYCHECGRVLLVEG